jgi:hypothetical protein
MSNESETSLEIKAEHSLSRIIFKHQKFQEISPDVEMTAECLKSKLNSGC